MARAAAPRRNPLTPAERAQVEKDLERLSGDPLRHERLDVDYDQFVNGQFETAYGGNSPEPKAHVRGDYVPRPDPSHFEISAPVGPGLENRYHDVVKIKKGLASSGAQPFDLTRERSTEVNERLFDGIRTLQDMVGAKADGIVNPLGETARKATPLMTGEAVESFVEGGEPHYVFPLPRPGATHRDAERDSMEKHRVSQVKVHPDGSVTAPLPPFDPVVPTHREAERRSMDALERDKFDIIHMPEYHSNLSLAQRKRYAAEIKPPEPGDNIAAFRSERAEEAARQGYVNEPTLDVIVRAMRHGTALQRAQAVAFLRQIEARNPEVINQIQDRYLDVVLYAAAKWARIEHNMIPKRDVEKIGPANLLFLLDGLDRYRGLSRESKAIINNMLHRLRWKHQSNLVVDRLNSIRDTFNRSKYSQPVATDQDIILAEEADKDLYQAAGDVGTLLGIGSLVFPPLAVPSVIASGIGSGGNYRIESLKALGRKRENSPMTARSMNLLKAALEAKRRELAEQREIYHREKARHKNPARPGGRD